MNVAIGSDVGYSSLGPFKQITVENGETVRPGDYTKPPAFRSRVATVEGLGDSIGDTPHDEGLVDYVVVGQGADKPIEPQFHIYSRYSGVSITGVQHGPTPQVFLAQDSDGQSALHLVAGQHGAHLSIPLRPVSPEFMQRFNVAAQNANNVRVEINGQPDEALMKVWCRVPLREHWDGHSVATFVGLGDSMAYKLFVATPGCTYPSMNHLAV